MLVTVAGYGVRFAKHRDTRDNGVVSAICQKGGTRHDAIPMVNGIRIRYELWGEGETPLVLLHGPGSSADDWLLQLPAFAPHFKCVPLDLRGHGASDKPVGRYSIALFAAARRR